MKKAEKCKVFFSTSITGDMYSKIQILPKQTLNTMCLLLSKKKTVSYFLEYFSERINRCITILQLCKCLKSKEVVPIFKKYQKKGLKKLNRLLLPSVSKLFRKSIYDHLANYFLWRCLTNTNLVLEKVTLHGHVKLFKFCK